MKELKLNGPFLVKLEVYTINDITGDVGEATIGMPRFTWPTKDKVKEALKKINVESGLTKGFRLMTKSEAVNYVLTGSPQSTLAISGNKEWDE